MKNYNRCSASHVDETDYCDSVSLEYLGYLEDKRKCNYENRSHEPSRPQEDSQQGRITIFIEFIWNRLRLICAGCSVIWNHLRLICADCSASAGLSVTLAKNNNNPSINSDQE